MKLVKRTESAERCAESGWFAYDFQMSGPLDRAFILFLKPLGNFVYLPALAKPFFKIEGDDFHIKGVEGACFFRVAVHSAREDFSEKLEKYLEGFPEVQE